MPQAVPWADGAGGEVGEICCLSSSAACALVAEKRNVECGEGGSLQ